MASSFTTSFGIEKIATGEQAGVWGTTTNHNADILDRIASYTSVALSGTTHTLTVREASPGAGTENLQDGMYRVIKFTGALGGNNTVTIAPNTSKAWFIVENATTDSGSSGPYSVILTQGSGANITLQNGKNAVVYCDGAGGGAVVFNALNDLQIATLEVTGAAAVDGLLTAGASVAVTGNVTTTGTVEPAGDTAASDNAAIGYTAAEGLILTGQGSTNDVTIKNDADGEVMGVLTGSTTAAFTGQVTATGFTGTLDGILGSGTAAAVSGTTIGASGLITANAKIDMTGTELILDDGGNTSITADTDNTIDIRINSADDFQFTANTFTALSGSDIAIASGATITNSGTATGFGADAERAIAGVLQTNANFVDQVIFGPSVDGVPWNGAWSKASVYSSLMLATIEDEGSNTEINIWDLTEQTSGAISTTPLATVDLSAAATPTSIAAVMGYLIVGSEDGIAIIDPHSGAWAERTKGWPRTLSTSTSPALSANTVNYVAAGAARQPAFDPRTGGPMPTFVVSYSGGSQASSIIKEDGTVFDRAGTGNVAGISNGDAYVNLGNVLYQVGPIDSIIADSYQHSQINNSASGPFGLQCDTAFSIHNGTAASADADGLTFHKINLRNVNGQPNDVMNAIVTRAYNSGFYTKDIRGIWLASSSADSDNEGEKDRSYHANNLTQNGTPTEAAVASGSELDGYSGFSSSVNFTAASNAEWDVITTGALCWSYWFKSTGAGGVEFHIGLMNSDASLRFDVYMNTNGTVVGDCKGATAEVSLTSGASYEDSVWHKLDFVRVSSTELYLYVDGISVGSSTTDQGSLSSSGNITLGIGVKAADGSSAPATSTSFALVRLSATAPSATQVRKAYDAEKGMFVASAECLLQSGSTDAVLDVDVDPLSGKVLVTQTDAITVFDGLVVDSKPTVNSGASEKGKLWGALRAEQNSANAYVTAPATDQRQVNEMVRGLANDMPKGVDLSKAKAWIKGNTDGTIASSYNIKANTSGSTGICYLDFGIPFKSAEYISIGGTKDNSSGVDFSISTWAQTTSRISMARIEDSADADGEFYMLFFGELENE
tara:strand:+ start:61 stop:3261 length:3201 start_codon:yes stop_codon:yes gene_type:complete